MKIECTWEATDIEAGRKIKTRDGKVYAICVGRMDDDKHWCLLRLHDHWVTEMMAPARIVWYLNNLEMKPLELT